MERGQSDSPSQNGSTGSGRSTPNSESSPGKLFVGGLSWQTTPEKLKEYFSQFGAITDVLVMKDPVTQVSDNLELLFTFLFPRHLYLLMESIYLVQLLKEWTSVTKRA